MTIVAQAVEAMSDPRKPDARVVKLSNNITNLTNAFHQISAYRENIASINKAVAKARIRAISESTLEGSQQLNQAAAIDTTQLGASIDNLDEATEDLSDEVSETNTGLGSLIGRIAKLTAGVAVVSGVQSFFENLENPFDNEAPPTPQDTNAGLDSINANVDSQLNELGRAEEKAQEAVQNIPPVPTPTPEGQRSAIDQLGQLDIQAEQAQYEQFRQASAMGDSWIKDMIRKHEGNVPSIYRDSEGYPTFGVGHLITPNDPEYGKPIGTPVSRERVEQAFEQDYQYHKRIAMRTPGYQQANALGRGAMIDLAFNMGAWFDTAGWKGKRTYQAFERGDFDTAAQYLREAKWYRQVGPGRGNRVTGLLAQGNDSVAPVPRGSPRLATQAAENAIAQRAAEGDRGAPVVVVAGGSTAPQNPSDVLGSINRPRQPKPRGQNTAREYREYFAA